MRSQVLRPGGAGIREAEIDGRISLYSATGAQALVLNETASDLWRLCDGTHTVDQVITLLAGAYGVAEETIRSDVEQAVTALVEHGVLVLTEAA